MSVGRGRARPPGHPRVIVTGAAGGIGGAVVARLRSRGATVVGLDLHSDGEGILGCDVRDQAAVDAAVAGAIDRLGGLDVLINNAGIGTPQSAGAAPDARALAVLDVNLLGPWRVTAAALPALRASRGRVINIASGLAHVALPFAPAYCASKRGLVAYSDALRLELGGEITVTTVYPGYIRTDIHQESRDRGVPLEGLVPAERLEDAARTITGAALGRPRRDLATTRRGAAGYALLRHAPRRVVDGAIRWHIGQAMRRGTFSGSGLAMDLAARLKRG